MKSDRRVKEDVSISKEVIPVLSNYLFHTAILSASQIKCCAILDLSSSTKQCVPAIV